MSDSMKRFPITGSANWTTKSGQDTGVIVVFMNGEQCYQLDNDYICDNCGTKLDIISTSMKCPICKCENPHLIPKPKKTNGD